MAERVCPTTDTEINIQELTGTLRAENQHENLYGDRSFSACAPKLWNQLPNNIRAAGSVAIFKRQLKTSVQRCSYQITMWISTSIL